MDVERYPRHGWLVAQGGGVEIAIVDEDGEIIRRIDIRSPLFVRDGSSAGPKAEDQMKWGETNSTIWGLYLIGETIVMVHARNATGDWQPGQIPQFNVFMNVWSAVDGKGLVSDIRLPDLPVGRDGSDLLVVDYGPGGRNPNVSRVQLLRVPVRAGIEGFDTDAAPVED